MRSSAFWAVVIGWLAFQGTLAGAETKRPFVRPFQKETVEERAARLGVDPSLLLPTPAQATEEAPQVYTEYELGTSSFDSYEIDFTWEEVPPSPAYLFQAFQFQFEAGTGGYIGPQLVPGRRMLFSIWDVPGGVTAIPLGNCNRFGGEGTGAQCPISYDWVTGRTYRMRVARYQVEAGSVIWQGTVRDTVTGLETLIGRIRLLNVQGMSGYGLLENHPLTWLEYFADWYRCLGQPRTRLTWRGPYANGQTVAPQEAIVDYTSCDISNVSSPQGRPLVVHEGGDGSVRTIAEGTDVWDSRATVSLDAAQVSISEAAGPARMRTRVTTVGGCPTTETVSLAYETSDGTARAGSDYSATSGGMTFPPGTPSGGLRNVNIPIVSDPLDEDAQETFGFSLHSITGAGVGAGAATITILDDDPTPEVFTSGVVVDEPDTGQEAVATFNVGLTGPSSRTVTVNFATADRTAVAGADYTALGVPIAFSPGATQASVSVRVLGDLLDEDDEQFDVRLSGAVHATVSAGDWRGTIRDDDPMPEVFTSSVNVSELDTQEAQAVFNLELSAPSGRLVSVGFFTADRDATAADYIAVSDTRVFPPGATRFPVPVRILGDNLDEDDEQFSFVLINPVNAIIRAGDWRGTVVDNDPLPRLSTQDGTITEGDNGSQELSFPLTLNTPSGRRVWVLFQTEDITARAGRDYVAQNTPYVIEPGQTVRNVPVAVFGDRVHEPGGETFRVKLAAPGNAVIAPPGPWLGTIADNDPQPTASVSDCTRVEGNGDTPDDTALCGFVVSLSNPSSLPVTVDYATAENPPPGADYQPASGTLTFDAEMSGAQTVNVTINGDLEPENNEEFLVNLTGPSNATVADGQGVGTIIDDEKSLFRPVTPCRVLDTRSSTPVEAGQARTFSVSGQCGVPLTAKAVAVNVTAVQQSAAGNLRLFPAALPVPGTSVLNFAAQTPRANNATVLLGTGGRLTVLADGAQSHVIVDVFGYYETER